MFEIDFERLAAVSICFVAAWPLARRLFQPKLWRNGSRKAVVASLLLSAYAISIVAAAFYAPMALWALTLAALIGIGLYVWITRDNFGRRQGLPPGSLAPAAHSDQASLLRRFRKHGPVFKVLARYQPAACVVGHSAASELLTSNADKLAAVPAAYNKHIPKGFLRYMRGADHAAYRRKFQSALPPSLVQSNEADLRALLRERFADWDGPVDPAVTSAMFAMMVRLFLGIMPDDPRAAKIRAAYGNIAVTDKAHAGGDRAADALTEVEEVLAELTNRPAVAGDTETVLGALLAGDALRWTIRPCGAI